MKWAKSLKLGEKMMIDVIEFLVELENSTDISVYISHLSIIYIVLYLHHDDERARKGVRIMRGKNIVYT